jgi:hypothetical protein
MDDLGKDVGDSSGGLGSGALSALVMLLAAAAVVVA